jgi:hypothetical protein
MSRPKSTKCSSATCKRIHDTAFKLCPDCRGIRYRYKRSEKGRAKAEAYRQTERHKLLHRAGMARYRQSWNYLEWVYAGERARYERVRRFNKGMDGWDRNGDLYKTFKKPRAMEIFRRAVGGYKSEQWL